MRTSNIGIAQSKTSPRARSKRFSAYCYSVLLGAIGMGALSGCADPNASSNEEQIQLKLADSYPTGHPFARFGAAVFMEEVERLSEGRINFSYFPAGQMGKAQDLPNLTRSGVIDIAAVAPAYVSEQLPLSGVADLD